MIIERTASALLVVDIQEKLAPAIHDNETVVRNTVRLLSLAQQLAVPAFVSEQYVRGLGPSVAEIRQAAAAATFFEKTHFACTAEPGVNERLFASGRQQFILTGTETHVCVLQTALGLRAAGREVFLVADAASSRTALNRERAIERLRHAGVHIVSTEMVMFEWLHRADTDEFRAALPLIK